MCLQMKAEHNNYGVYGWQKELGKKKKKEASISGPGDEDVQSQQSHRGV